MTTLTAPTTLPTPTRNAIKKAVLHAERSGRTVEQSDLVPHLYLVTNPRNRRDYHIVNVKAGFRKCSCARFARNGVCPCQVLADDHIRYEEEQAARAEAWGDDLGKF